jgi:hypothetical protein
MDRQHSPDPRPTAKVNLPIPLPVEPSQEPKVCIVGSPNDLTPAGIHDGTRSRRVSSGRQSSISGPTADRVFPVRSEIGIDPLRSPQSLPRRASSTGYSPPDNIPAGKSEEYVAEGNDDDDNNLRPGGASEASCP